MIGSEKRGYLQGRYPFVRVGDGPRPLVFVPGIEDAMFDGQFGPLAARLVEKEFRRYRDDFTVHAVSRPRGLEEGTSVGDMAETYAAVVEDEFGSASVLGVSMGGMIVQELARRRPDVVDRAVVGVSGCRLSEEGQSIGRDLRRLSTERRWTAIRTRLLDQMYTGARRVAYPRLSNTVGRLLPPNPAVPQDVTVSMDAVLEFDATDRLDEIDPPTLVVGGSEDPFFPEAILRETAEGVPHSELAIFNGARHGAFKEHKPTFDGIVTQFLAERPVRVAVPNP